MHRKYCGGPLSELCAHKIDVVNFLLESHPMKVSGMGGINYWKDGRDTYDHIGQAPISIHMGNAAADTETSRVWKPAYPI